jgi:hypothetical protein
MKRNFVIATLVALMLVTGLVVTASAQTAQPTPTTPVTAGACANGNWVDANNDGVCDNAPRDGSGMQFGQQNGQGMNRGNGQAQGQGMQGRGMQNGQGQGMGQGAGQGANFVDENKDGVCDNFGTAQGQQSMQRRGMQGRGMQGHGMQGHGMQGRGMQNGQGWNN